MVSKYAQQNGSALGGAVHRVMSPLFTVMFTIARTLVGPSVFVVVVKGLHESKVLPRSAVLAWSAMSVVGVLGSWIWVRKLLRGLAKSRAKDSAARATKKRT